MSRFIGYLGNVHANTHLGGEPKELPYKDDKVTVKVSDVEGEEKKKAIEELKEMIEKEKTKGKFADKAKISYLTKRIETLST